MARAAIPLFLFGVQHWKKVPLEKYGFEAMQRKNISVSLLAEIPSPIKVHSSLLRTEYQAMAQPTYMQPIRWIYRHTPREPSSLQRGSIPLWRNGSETQGTCYKTNAKTTPPFIWQYRTQPINGGIFISQKPARNDSRKFSNFVYCGWCWMRDMVIMEIR